MLNNIMIGIIIYKVITITCDIGTYKYNDLQIIRIMHIYPLKKLWILQSIYFNKCVSKKVEK